MNELSSLWIFPEIEASAAKRLAAALGISAPAALTLVHRGFAEPESARHFLEASIGGLHDPFLMPDMDRAAERLERAVRTSEKILIYGDYDVDGAASVALMVKAIELAGSTASWHVPNRLKDGYGMREGPVEAAAAEGVTLIVSVDTGIRASAVVGRAAELGIDVIVTDHHLPESALPPAVAILNPNRSDCEYPDKNLCGAAVACKLALALLSRLGWSAERLRRVSDSFLKLVAIATVADVTPLTGENRVIVKHGLEGFRDLRSPGLRALLEVAGITGTAPTARQVAFQIAPRINAAGRMDTAEAVIELFVTPDDSRARELAGELNERNAQRQRAEADIREACERAPVEAGAATLVFYDPEWHRGVLGIVASRLVERYRRPVFVLGLNPEDGLAQGSGRGIPAFHLLDALDSMPDLFVRYGGHRHAAGVTLDPNRIGEFRGRLNAYAITRLGPDDFLQRLEIDAVVELAEVGESAARDLWALAPFGLGNQTPLLATLGVEVAAAPVPFGEDHLRVVVKSGGRSLTLKAWRFAGRAAELSAGAHLDIAFTLEEDPYSAARGYEPWSANLRDVRPAG